MLFTWVTVLDLVVENFMVKSLPSGDVQWIILSFQSIIGLNRSQKFTPRIRNDDGIEPPGITSTSCDIKGFSLALMPGILRSMSADPLLGIR